MAEPTSTGIAVAGAFGAGLAGVLAGVDSAAAVGSLCGSVIYFISSKELQMPERLTYFLISFVMGYLLAPAITGIEAWGIKPFAMPAPAAWIRLRKSRSMTQAACFGASLMVVTISLPAIKRRGRNTSIDGGVDGQLSDLRNARSKHGDVHSVVYLPPRRSAIPSRRIDHGNTDHGLLWSDIYILAGDLVIPYKTWLMVLLMAVLTASLMRCGGNMSKVLRHPMGWDGRKRRDR
jgi:hypothetical protein